jgi:hypothetical protein
MVELISLIALAIATTAYGVLIRFRAQRRPVERRLRELQPLIAPWVARTRAAAN